MGWGFLLHTDSEVWEAETACLVLWLSQSAQDHWMRVGVTRQEAATVCSDCPQHPKSMFNGGLSPGMLYWDMQLQGLGYSPGTS